MTEATEKEALAQKPHEVLPVQFVRVNEYTTFDCELAILEGDLVFHFYVTEEVNEGPSPRTYWLEHFPSVLSDVAQEYFGAGYPQVKAAYTEEKASWWMRAYGFGLKLDPHKYSYRFLEKLDAALEARKTT